VERKKEIHFEKIFMTTKNSGFFGFSIAVGIMAIVCATVLGFTGKVDFFMLKFFFLV